MYPSLSTVGPVGFNESLARILVGRLMGSSVAERIRRAIADLEIHDAGGVRVPVTASLGIAYRRDRVRGAGAALLEQALGLADQALYVAKRNGKNRFEFVTVGEPAPLPA